MLISTLPESLWASVNFHDFILMRILLQNNFVMQWSHPKSNNNKNKNKTKQANLVNHIGTNDESPRSTRTQSNSKSGPNELNAPSPSVRPQVFSLS